MNQQILIPESEFILQLKEAILSNYGSQKAFAEQHDISTAYVNDFFQGKRLPGQKILDAVGAEKVVTYRFLS
jgi:hypothetical protein